MTDPSVINWRAGAGLQGPIHALVTKPASPPRHKVRSAPNVAQIGSGLRDAWSSFYECREGLTAGRCDGTKNWGSSQLAVVGPPRPRGGRAAGDVFFSNPAGKAGTGRAI